MAVDDEIVNRSENRPFEDVLNAHLSRRKMMKGTLATAATGFLASSGVAKALEGDEDDRGGRPRRSRIGFTPAENPGGPEPTISEDYEYSVLIPWGLPLFPGVPELDPTDVTANGADNQAQQIGCGHDGMAFFGDPDEKRRGRPSNDRGVLCINHEYGVNDRVLRKSLPESLEDVRISQAVHGVSVVELAKKGGQWDAVVPGARNRRITPNTPVEFSGPAAGSPLLATAAGNPGAGTVNNCANGRTPWGTYLTCEENFNGYFGANDEAWEATPEQARYGFSSSGFRYGWHLFDERWDLSNPDYQNEENRFGYVVEIDPNQPLAKPVKRTALGRFKHESVEIVIGRGRRVVAYMGDDQRFDYIYKFVSADNYRRMLRRGKSPLDEGTLYVARFNADGTGDWLPLTPDNPALAGWTEEEIAVYTRLAADAVGATPMDRPEWITRGRRQEIFCALTNNTRRTEPNAANPLAPNPDGHIIRWRDEDRFTGTKFAWDIFVLAQDTRVENGGAESFTFTDPDGLWADPFGRLFIQTDGGQPFGNNQMVVADIRRHEFKRLFAGVDGDEITGIATTPDYETMFINTQHPGGNGGDPAVTNFPIPGAGGPEVPRAATFAITRKKGGVIGS